MRVCRDWSILINWEPVDTFINNKGYKIARINWRLYRVNRVVAGMYIPNPEWKECVDHINGDKLDNRVENLQRLTHSDNTKKGYRETGRINWNACEVEQICPFTGDVLEEYPSMSHAAKANWTYAQWISFCCSGKQHTAWGYKWRLKNANRLPQPVNR